MTVDKYHERTDMDKGIMDQFDLDDTRYNWIKIQFVF